MPEVKDPALRAANQKSWNRTRPIMISNVLAFLFVVLANIALSLKWIITTFVFSWATIICVILAITFAWDLETEL